MPPETGQEMSEALLTGLRQGREAAQRELWERFSPVVYAVSLRILGDGFAANEVAAEVLYDFMSRYVHRLSCPQAARTYLKLMAARRAARAREARDRHPAAEVDYLPDAPGVSAEDRSLYGLLRPRLEACLGGLTPKAQRIVKLRFISELTNEQIGGIVGGSKQYIGRLLTRVMDALKRCLTRAGPMPEGEAP